MGTQQILLIVLSVIIVGIAVAVGISMFNTQSAAADQQAVNADLQSFAAQVIAYLKTPTSMGGGGHAVAAGDETAIGQWMGWGGATLTNTNDTYTITIAGGVTITATTATSTMVIPANADDMDDVTLTVYVAAG